jgi:hypothetical protein
MHRACAWRANSRAPLIVRHREGLWQCQARALQPEQCFLSIPEQGAYGLQISEKGPKVLEHRRVAISCTVQGTPIVTSADLPRPSPPIRRRRSKRKSAYGSPPRLSRLWFSIGRDWHSSPRPQPTEANRTAQPTITRPVSATSGGGNSEFRVRTPGIETVRPPEPRTTRRTVEP